MNPFKHLEKMSKLFAPRKKKVTLYESLSFKDKIESLEEKPKKKPSKKKL